MTDGNVGNVQVLNASNPSHDHSSKHVRINLFKIININSDYICQIKSLEPWKWSG